MCLTESPDHADPRALGTKSQRPSLPGKPPLFSPQVFILRCEPRIMAADPASTASFANTLTLISIEAGSAKILIDPCLSDNPSWDKGWIGSRAGEDSTQGGGR